MNQSAQVSEYEDAAEARLNAMVGYDSAWDSEIEDWEKEAADFNAAPDTNALSDIAKMAAKMMALDEEIESATVSLDALKKARVKVAEVDIPVAMEGAGLQGITLANGRQLTVKENLFASIPKGNKASAAAWLVEHDHASLIETEVKVAFDRGDEDLAKDLKALLIAQGFKPIVTDDMNTARVKSAINEMREQGIDVPLPLFGAYIKKEAVIK
jgi:hypothetical protein